MSRACYTILNWEESNSSGAPAEFETLVCQLFFTILNWHTSVSNSAVAPDEFETCQLRIVKNKREERQNNDKSVAIAS